MRIPVIAAAAMLLAAPATAMASIPSAAGHTVETPKQSFQNVKSNRGQEMKYQNCVRRVYRACVRQSTGRHGRHACAYRARAVCGQ